MTGVDDRELRGRVFALTAKADETGTVPIDPSVVKGLLELLGEVRAVAETLRQRVDEAEREMLRRLSERDDAKRLLEQARADAETLRQRHGSFLDWAIGFVVAAVEADEEVGRPWLERMEHRLREERAALAAAQDLYRPAAHREMEAHANEFEGWTTCPVCNEIGTAACVQHKHLWQKGWNAAAQEPPAYREGDKCDGCRRWWFASGAWHSHNPRSVTHCVRSVTCPECAAQEPPAKGDDDRG